MGSPPIFRARIFTAIRTIEEAKRCQIRVRLTRAVPLSPDDASAGFIDLIEVEDGRVRIAGWTSGHVLQIGTERQTRTIPAALERDDVPAEYKARGFDLHLNGSDRLVVDVDGTRAVEIDLTSSHDGMAAWLRTAGRLVQVPLVLGGELFNYMSRGDADAGQKLEDFLLPPREAPDYLFVKTGIFSGSSAVRDDGAPVDIILPVYDAFDDVRECLDRLGRHTDLRHTIIIVDDASTDTRIAPLLEDFAAGREGTVLIRAPRNRGFVHSVNSGLAKAKGDVVLLNSDAFVPEGWLPRLMAPIRRDPSIASVTPMSNNAEIASVPVICQPADLPDGAADAVDRVAGTLKDVATTVPVPTGVGFCLALSRRWLNRVPAFDTSFGQGYGEEVDWCQNIRSLGGKHVLVGTLFVEHRGGSSFGPEKLARIAASNRKIAARYPGFDAMVQEFRRSDPAIAQRLALGLAQAGLTGRVPIYLGHRMGGGAEFWLEERIARTTRKNEMAVVVRDGDVADHALLELHHDAGLAKANVPLDDLPEYLGLLPEKRVVYSCLVGARDAHKLLDAVAATMADGDALELAFHDYFAICPSQNLLAYDGKFCGVPDTDTCKHCYPNLTCQTEVRPKTVDEWRTQWRRWIERASELTVFSPSSHDIVTRCYPEASGKIRLRPHKVTQLPPKINVKRNARPVIGVLGGIGFPKGAGILRDLAAETGGELDIVVIGEMDPTYLHPDIRVHGRYKREDIATLVRNYGIDRWFLPSICPETFSYATHECLATGLPVFVFDLGAQADAVRSRPNGRVLPVDLMVPEIAAELAAHRAPKDA